MARVATVAAFLMLAAVLAIALSATPQQRDAARDLVRAAKVHFQSGEFRDAAKKLQVAFDLVGEPSIAYNLARALERAEDRPGAAAAYRAYLAADPDASDRKAVEAAIASLEKPAEPKLEPPPLTPAPELVEAPAREPQLTGPTVLGVAAVASAVTALSFGLLANSWHSSAMQGPVEDAEPMQRQARGYALAANVSWGVFAATAVSAAVWLIVELTRGR